MKELKDKREFASSIIQQIMVRFYRFESDLGIIKRNEYNDNIMISPIVDTKKMTKLHCELMKDVGNDCMYMADKLIEWNKK